MKIESHVHNIINKPWGYEYLVYESKEVALWLLYIKKDAQTSFHSHPKKTTGLIVLDGIAEISFFKDSYQIKTLQKTMIRKGFFHSTKSLSDNGTYLFEIETPNDKLDLVRLKDSYGREGLPYESSDFEIPKIEDCLWFGDSRNIKQNTYKFKDIEFSVLKFTNINEFENFDFNTNIMFLSGGLSTEYGVNVISPGDILNIATILEFKNVFDKINFDTYAVVFQKC